MAKVLKKKVIKLRLYIIIMYKIYLYYIIKRGFFLIIVAISAYFFSFSTELKEEIIEQLLTHS